MSGSVSLLNEFSFGAPLESATTVIPEPAAAGPLALTLGFWPYKTLRM